MARGAPKPVRSDRSSSVVTKRQPGRNGGWLKVGNPGNKSKLEQYAHERAALLAADSTVWDVQLARAKSGDIKPLIFATEWAFGRPRDVASAQVETPDGWKFTLILGERAQPDD